jgi:hypothetical protein
MVFQSSLMLMTVQLFFFASTWNLFGHSLIGCLLRLSFNSTKGR